MEPYVVSFRKYRPQRFDSVVGQLHITSTLKNAIKSQQLAQAFLFCGPRGVGKTTCARIFAKTINCTAITAQAEACDQCESCQSFNRGASLAIHELDAASNNSVDDIRNLVDQVRYLPQGSKYKIYIIDEVHMLSTAAFNAFLKTLEEPPSYAIFILATTERHKILPTILSRCQIFDFNRIQVNDISQQLASICQQEGVEFEAPALHLIAQKADGALRDALSIMDQIISFSGGKLTFQAVIDNLNIIDYEYYFRATDMMYGQQMAEISLLFDEVIQKGFDGINFVVGLASHFRDLLMAKDANTLKLLQQSPEVTERYRTQSKQLDAGFLLTALNLASQCEVNYKQSKNPRLLVELFLMKACFLRQQIHPSQLPQSDDKKKAADKPAVTNLSNAPAAIPLTPASTAAAVPSVTVKQPSAARIKVSSSVSKTRQNLQQQPTADATASESTQPEEQTVAETRLSFQEAWQLWLESIKTAKKDYLHSLMSKLQPEPDQEHRFLIPIHSDAQHQVMEEEKQEMLQMLRHHTGNYALQLAYAWDIPTAEAAKPVTSAERFEQMSKKNPNVLEFAKRLDLEIQY
jgi:DNA polymerase-3 subunit gamma/tau